MDCLIRKYKNILNKQTKRYNQSYYVYFDDKKFNWIIEEESFQNKDHYWVFKELNKYKWIYYDKYSGVPIFTNKKTSKTIKYINNQRNETIKKILETEG